MTMEDEACTLLAPILTLPFAARTLHSGNGGRASPVGAQRGSVWRPIGKQFSGDMPIKVIIKPGRILSVAVLLLAAGCSPREQPAVPNREPPELILLISLDTLRADRLGCYGADRNTSPNLDKLAAEGVRFTTVAAQATQTLISHKSMFAAKYPLRLARDTNNATLERLATVAEPLKYMVATFQHPNAEPLVSRLRNHGWTTAAFTDGGWMTRQFGFARGFNNFDQHGGRLQAILPRVYAWLSRNMTGRRFLFIHAFDTHCPYWCREPYNSIFCPDHSKHVQLENRCGSQSRGGKTGLMHMDLSKADLQAVSDHYDGGVASADAHMGELFHKLRKLGLYDEALIVVTSDHGESLGLHGQIGHGGLYLEQLMVPLIVKFPASWNLTPAVSPTPVELVDVMPTILDVSGLEVPDDIDGRSLLPAVRSGGRGRRQLITQMTFKEGPESISNPCKRALLDPGRWLLIHDARSRTAQLFNLTTDPRGLTNLADEHPALLVNLAATLAAREAGQPTGEFLEPEHVEISDELRQELESLGYVED